MKVAIFIFALILMGCGGGDVDDGGSNYGNVKLDFDYNKRLADCKGKACLELANIYYDRSDKSKYKKEIVESFQKGCNTGNYTSCFFIATLYNDGDFLAKDTHNFQSFMDKAWDIGTKGQKAAIVILYPDYNR